MDIPLEIKLEIEDNETNSDKEDILLNQNKQIKEFSSVANETNNVTTGKEAICLNAVSIDIRGDTHKDHDDIEEPKEINISLTETDRCKNNLGIRDIKNSRQKDNLVNTDMENKTNNNPNKEGISNNNDKDLTEEAVPFEPVLNHNSVDIEKKNETIYDITDYKADETVVDLKKQETNKDNKQEKEIVKVDIETDNTSISNLGLEEETNIYPELTQENLTIDTENATGSSSVVKVISYSSITKRLGLGRHDPNDIIIYQKKFTDILVALYKTYEYKLLPLPEHCNNETRWRCTKSEYCPALLLIGKNDNSKVYEVSKHTCVMDVIDEAKFPSFTLVDVLYHEGINMPGLNSDYLLSLGKGILILYQDNRTGTKNAFYNGYKYIRSLVSKDFFEYGCRFTTCQGSLKLTCVGTGKKMVLEMGGHTCIQGPTTNKKIPKTNPTQIVPKGFIAVTPLKYRTYTELLFLLNASKLHPIPGLPFLFVKDWPRKRVCYQEYEYYFLFLDGQPDSTTLNFRCKTKSCQTYITVSLDFRAVFRPGKHCCEPRVPGKLKLYNLLQISHLSDIQSHYNTGSGNYNMFDESLSAYQSRSKSEYIGVTYKYLTGQNGSGHELDPNDSDTVSIYFDSKSQRSLCYYKGYTYIYEASIPLCLCSISAKCAATLILCPEQSEVMEIGKHTCDPVYKSTSESNEIIFVEDSMEPPEEAISIDIKEHDVNMDFKVTQEGSTMDTEDNLVNIKTENETRIKHEVYDDEDIEEQDINEDLKVSREGLTMVTEEAKQTIFNTPKETQSYDDKAPKEVKVVEEETNIYPEATQESSINDMKVAVVKGNSSQHYRDSEVETNKLQLNNSINIFQLSDRQFDFTTASTGNNKIVEPYDEALSADQSRTKSGVAYKYLTSEHDLDSNDSDTVTIYFDAKSQRNLCYYKGYTYIYHASIQCSCHISATCTATLIIGPGQSQVMERGKHTCDRICKSASECDEPGSPEEDIPIDIEEHGVNMHTDTEISNSPNETDCDDIFFEEVAFVDVQDPRKNDNLVNIKKENEPNNEEENTYMDFKEQEATEDSKVIRKGLTMATEEAKKTLNTPEETQSYDIDTENETSNDHGEEEGTNILNDSEKATGSVVKVISYHSTNKRLDVGEHDPNDIIIYHKKFADILVALYKTYEYKLLSLPEHCNNETRWRCNKSKYCPALLLIGKDDNSKVYLVSEHTCVDVIDERKFPSFTLVEVLYYDGSAMSGLNSDYLLSLGKGILILCRDDKYGARNAYYNGYKYIRSIVTKVFFEYGCRFTTCEGSLKLTRLGIDKKMVLEMISHTCRQGPNTNKKILKINATKIVPKGFIEVTPLKYRPYSELLFFLSVNKLRPITGLPLLFFKEYLRKVVFYQEYEYYLLSEDKEPVSTTHNTFRCKTKSCPAILDVTFDYKAVSIREKHFCDSQVEAKKLQLCDLIKISQLSDRKFDYTLDEVVNETASSAGQSTSKSEYKRVTFKYLTTQNASGHELDPNDADTITAYFDSQSQRNLSYYKGYSYIYGASLQLCLCIKSATCAASLILRPEQSEVMEIGKHTCDHIGKSPSECTEIFLDGSMPVKQTAPKRNNCNRPCPVLAPIGSKSKKSSKKAEDFANSDEIAHKIKDINDGSKPVKQTAAKTNNSNRSCPVLAPIRSKSKKSSKKAEDFATSDEIAHKIKDINDGSKPGKQTGAKTNNSNRSCPVLAQIRPMSTKSSRKAEEFVSSVEIAHMIKLSRIPTEAVVNIPDINDTLDKLKYTLVKIKNCLETGVNLVELDPSNTTNAYVYRDEAGRPIIYYKGHTYHYYHKSRIIYLCSKSRGCSAALKPHTSRRYEMAEVGEHNCTLTSSLPLSHEPQPIKFKIYSAKEFSQIPNFDPDNHSVVTMLINDLQRHNVVNYKEHKYIDDKSLSCDRGDRRTGKSCNLIYMCVKSNVCSAGLITNIHRTAALEVGFHRCNVGFITDQNKLFRELQPVTFLNSADGKPDIQDSTNAQVVITYFKHGKKAAFYNGYTYMDRMTCCSLSVGCKCLYLCYYRSTCSAAILVDSRQAVLEVGLHNCAPEIEPISVADSSFQFVNVAEENSVEGPISSTISNPQLPEPTPAGLSATIINEEAINFQDPSLSRISQTTKGNKDLTSQNSSSKVNKKIGKKIKRKADFSFDCPNLKKTKDDCSYKLVKTISHLENNLEMIPFEEQKQFFECLSRLEFRGYQHVRDRKKGHYIIYSCLYSRLYRCSGHVLAKDGRLIWAKNHICQIVKRERALRSDQSSSNYIIVYYSDDMLSKEVLYKGYSYSRRRKGENVMHWSCSESINCKGTIKINDNYVAELEKHSCDIDKPNSIETRFDKTTELNMIDKAADAIFSNDIETSIHIDKALKANRLFKKITSQLTWCSSLIPALDEKDGSCVIYKGYIYTYTGYSYMRDSLNVSEWMCIQTNCLAMLHLDSLSVVSASTHYCYKEVPISSAEQSHSIHYIPTDESLSLRCFYSDVSVEKRHFMYAGYIYKPCRKKMTGHCLISKCIYTSPSSCCGTLSLKNNVPITVSEHSCRNLIPCEVGDNDLMEDNADCSETVVNENFETEAMEFTENGIKKEVFDEENNAESHSIKSEPDEITVKAEEVEQITYVEEPDNTFVLDRPCLLPDLLPFGQTPDPNNSETGDTMPLKENTDSNNLIFNFEEYEASANSEETLSAKDEEIICFEKESTLTENDEEIISFEEESTLSANDEEIISVEEGSILSAKDEELISFEEGYIKVEENDVISISDDESEHMEPMEIDPLNIDDSVPNTKCLEYPQIEEINFCPEEFVTNKFIADTILQKALTNPVPKRNYTKPYKRVQEVSPECSQTKQVNVTQISGWNNSDFSNDQDLEDMIPVTVVAWSSQ